MIALYENQPVSARVRLTDDDYLRTRYYPVSYTHLTLSTKLEV